jgi:L-ascorbate metabolism protein UlaG (beta-lactamase superfamily)
VDIQWFGEGRFRLRAAGGVVVTDPHAPPSAALRSVEADIVTLSHDRDGADLLAAVGGAPFVVRGPGEYEVDDIFIVGVRLSPGALGPTTAYCIAGDGVTVCHLGQPGKPPSQTQVEALGGVDVLLLPVGGQGSLGPAQAVEAVNLIEPAIVVPMLFRSDDRPDLEPIERFLAEMGGVHPEAEEVLRVLPNRLPDEPTVMLLRPKA